MAQKNPFVDLWTCFWNRWTAAVEVKCHRKILASEAKNEKKLTKKKREQKERWSRDHFSGYQQSCELNLNRKHEHEKYPLTALCIIPSGGKTNNT